MAVNSLCSIPNCGKRAVNSRGWCQKHYMRWWVHGDPLRDRQGPAKSFYRDVVLTYDGTDCLIWPFGHDRHGYAQMKHEGSTRIVSRRVCEETYGPPPTPEHDAAHSCGNGRQGCVAKRHLSWKTPLENSADMEVHGTLLFGERHGMAKVSEDDVHYIRAMRGKISQSKLARMFGMTQVGISFIQLGKNWKRIPFKGDRPGRETGA